MRSVICLLILLTLPGFIFSQKKFDVTFLLPDSIEIRKLSFSYYDCHERVSKPIEATYHHNKATIVHTYHTIYAQIFVTYGDYAMSVYTTDKPAKVIIKGPIDQADPFKNYELVNAQYERDFFKAADNYKKEALDQYRHVYDSVSLVWNPSDSLGYYKVKEAQAAVDLKQLEYIEQHPDAYASFLLFEKYTISLLPPDLLLHKFNSIFPAKFRDSEEGNCVKAYLLDRAEIDGKKKAISFTARDIDNNEIIFKNLYDKKDVLLVFWGTWCQPCLEEIPVLRAIRQRYSKDQLEMVSVATRSETDKVRALIKKEQMDWVHIVNDNKINTLYQVHAYPEVYLIGAKGDIVYKYTAYPDLQLTGLQQLLDNRLKL